LEKQVAALVARKASADSKEGAGLADIKKYQDQIDGEKIAHNRHTLLTYRDVVVQWEQYTAFLSRKQKQLEDEIQHKKLRGVTPEQYAEIEMQFKQFDANGNGILEKSEFRACLFSLGYDIDVKTVMVKYGSGDKVGYDGFKNFMIDQLGDSDTKDEILLGFKLINKQSADAKPDLMTLVLADDMLEYIAKNSPKRGDGYDYTTLTESLFAR